MVYLRVIVAIVLGAFLGSTVNMGLIIGGSSIIPAPDGVDITSAISIAASIDLFELKHFVFPFLAHALGTLAGAMAAYLVAPFHRMRFALGIGALFFVGGAINMTMIPAPLWFNATDLIFAYFPMGWLGGLLGAKLRSMRIEEES